MKVSLLRFSHILLTTLCLLGLTAGSGPATKTSYVELRIGVVQRFGEQPTDTLELQPTTGSNLRLKFQVDNREQTLVTADPLKLSVVMQTLREPIVEERVVLGTYRTFETAEDSAKKWLAQGIEVEIAQPERWQVWAKRDIYNTALLRRLLLQSVQAFGSKTSYIDSEIVRQVPTVNWVVDNKSYSEAHLEISSDKNVIQVNKNNKPDNTRLYPGQLELQPNAYGTYTLVNDVPLETYLRGVVPNEIGGNTPTAALEAQAILARTYVLGNLRRFAIDNYELCADPNCQVYYGLTGTTTNSDQAIAATRGMVLTYNNQLADALYSSTTGGVTASFSDVWNGEDRPYLKPVIDSPEKIWNLATQSLANEDNFQRFIEMKQGFDESGTPLFRWHYETSLKDITKDLQKFLHVKNSPYAKIKEVRSLQVTNRSDSGRILSLAVNTDIGTFKIHKDEVRSAFAAPKSTLFYLQPLNKGNSGLWGYAFIGGGFGHGVGLSQTGAENLAKLGWSDEKILQFYYPGTKIKSLGNLSR